MRAAQREGSTVAKPRRKPPKLHEYGVRQPPSAPSRLRTKPVIIPHNGDRYWTPPREGRGDYRHLVAGAVGAGTRFASGDHRSETGHTVWVPIRNDLPESVPYVWRPEGWERYAVKAGLDLAAIAAADAELDMPGAFTCARCGSPFAPSKRSQRFCGKVCREANQYARHVERVSAMAQAKQQEQAALTPARAVRACARRGCGNTFVPTGYNHKYCSPGCRAYGR